MRVLVTGKNGQLGRSIHEIVSNSPQNKDFVYTGRQELDFSSESSIDRYFEGNVFDIIINCAAYTAVDKAEEEKNLANQINHLAVRRLAQIAKKQRAKLIHISTDYVFDGENNKPYTETDETNPINFYGKTKLAGELALKEVMPNDAMIIRTSCVYSEYGNNFVKNILKLAKEKEEVSVVDYYIGSPTDANKLAKVILEIIDRKIKPGVYHYAGSNCISRYKWAKKITLNYKLDVKKIKAKGVLQEIAKRPEMTCLSSEKIIKEFNLKNDNYEMNKDIGNNKILILGANGFVGNYLFNMDFQGVEKFSSARISNECNLKFDAEKDDEKKIVNFIEENSVSVVINCVSMSNVDDCEKNKVLARKLNYEFPVNLAKKLKEDVKLIHMSSNAVYRGDSPPYGELDEKCPVNYYGTIKKDADFEIQKIKKNCVIIRPITIIGNKIPLQRENPFSFFYKKLKAGDDIVAVNDVKVNFLDIDILSKALKVIVNNNLTGEFNISGDDSLSRYEFVVLLKELLGSESKITSVSSDNFETLVKRPKDTSFNNEKMKSVLNLAPDPLKVSLIKMIKKEDASIHNC